MPTRPSQTKFSTQNILNNSYDTDFDVLTHELLGYDASTQTLKRISVNTSGQIIISGSVGSGGATIITEGTKIPNYTFNKTTKTVTFSDFSTIRLDCIYLIVNATTGDIIFNATDPTLGGTVSTNVLTLEYDTSAMADTDKLIIFYNDDTAVQSVSLANALSGIIEGLENDSIVSLPGLRSDSFQTAPVLVHTTNAVSVKAAVALKKIYITDMTISTDGGAVCDLLIQDDTGTPVVIDRIFLPAVATTIPFSFKTPKYTSVGQALTVKCSSATPNIYVSASGYTYT